MFNPVPLINYKIVLRVHKTLLGVFSLLPIKVGGASAYSAGPPACPRDRAQSDDVLASSFVFERRDATVP